MTGLVKYAACVVDDPQIAKFGPRTMEDPAELRKDFERAGRAAIRVQQEANRATGAPMQDREIEARKWLAELDEADAKEAASKRDAREEETLAIAREANKYARKANIWAAIAALIAAAAMYFSKS